MSPTPQTSTELPASRTELRATFLAVAAHDLRGRLANVRSYASLLMSPRLALDDRARRSVEVIARNTDAALALAQDIFDAMRAEAGGLRLEPERGPVQPLLEKVLEQASPLAQERNVRLNPLELGPLPELECDPDRFQRSALGLLRHAIARGDEGRTAGLAAATHPGWLRTWAWDEGPLLDAEAIERAFDLDRRVAEEKRLSSGFELALSAALTRVQGGRCGAFVDDSGHQCFFFELPLPVDENDLPTEP